MHAVFPGFELGGSSVNPRCIGVLPPRPPGPEASSRLGQKNGKQHPGLLPHGSGSVALACKVL